MQCARLRGLDPELVDLPEKFKKVMLKSEMIH
jgi:hypothetical protein